MFKENPYSNALRQLKINSHHMKQASETKNLKETLRYSKELLSQLSVEDLDIRDYYSLFMLASQDLNWLSEDLNKLSLKDKKFNFYEIVQFSNLILP